ncbi:MAG: protein phosphatase 2C domain-containing protein, partial [Rhodothermales bacterium]
AHEKMGTTCTAMALVDGHVHMAHVGDSRAYRIDEQGIEQLTHDHTLVEELRRQGVLTADEARNHPRRHALTRAMGIEPTLEVDVLEAMPIQSPQTYLLCSDGLAPVVNEEIRQVVATHPPQEASERLVQMVNERGGPDNVTVLLITING